MPFLIQLWLYVTPVIYPAEIVPEDWRWVLNLNPITGLIEGFRYGLLAWPHDWSPMTLVVSGCVAIVLFLLGMIHFHWLEDRFADIV